jgi:hypothetical protein
MANKAAEVPEPEKPSIPLGLVLVAWLVPGAGHFAQRRWGRGALLFASLCSMFALGLVMRGRFFRLAPGNIVETLGFLGDFCSGLLFMAARFWGYDLGPSPSPFADYGTKFLLVAGLLNVLCVLDAYDIAVGNKD